MTGSTKRGLVPKLRFPEFRDAGLWEKKTLDDIAVFFKGKGISKSDVDLQGDTQCIRYGELYTIYGEVIKKVVSKTKLPSSELFFSQKNDVLIPSSGETKIDIAKASCVLLDDVALGGDLNVLRPNENGIFLSYMLNGVCKTDIAKKAQGDTVVHLYASQLKLLGVIVPKEPEQQKIADCLSSIDEMLTFEAQKLAALKAHKKGLMQQLFPAEGDTLPKLRFPEFRDKGEWQEKELSQLGELVSGLTYSPEDVRDAGLLVLRSSNVQNGMIALDDNVYVLADIKGANPSRPNDILICVRNGSKSLIGKNALIPEGMPPCTHGAFMTVFRSKSAKFIFQLFQTEIYEKQVSADLGATINSINGNQLKKYKFFVPESAEQQKIVDCLTSIDDLITAQSKKIDTLKAHKKGLMQQLFPALKEVQR
jgi:type I restriction enzyme S subunit